MKLPPHQEQGLEANTPANEVKQKMYDLTFEQTNAIVKSFKNQFNVLALSKSSNNQTSLALDSSIWILEAALNSDFDTERTTQALFTDSIKINVPINGNIIDGNDFNNAYLTLKSLVSQKLNNSSIEVIDITAKVMESEIQYFLSINLFNSSSSYKVAGACDPFTTETASPSLMPAVIPNTNPFLSCTGNPTLDGPTAVMSKLNNCFTYSACQNGFYYTNVTNKYLNGDQNPSALYYRNNLAYADVCLNANKIINATTLNQYKTGCQTWGIANIPATPASMSIINYSITYNGTTTVCYCGYYYIYWGLKVQYGVRVCSNPSGGG